MASASVFSRQAAGSTRLVARTRLDLLRCTRSVVCEVAPDWGDEDDAVTIVVTDPQLTRAGVRSAIDEIDERYHVSGIDLEIDEQPGRAFRVTLRAS